MPLGAFDAPNPLFTFLANLHTTFHGFWLGRRDACALLPSLREKNCHSLFLRALWT